LTTTTQVPHGRSLDAGRCARLSGAAFAILFSTGSALWALGDWPSAGAPTAEIVDFYRDTSDRIVIGASLSLLALAAFLVFAAAVRQMITEAGGGELLATVAFAGAVLGSAAGLGAETINMVGALRAGDGELSDALAQATHEISQILGSTATGLGIGVFALATAASALRTGLILPRWLAVVTAIVGAALLTPVSRVPEVSGGSMVLITAMFALLLLRARVEDQEPVATGAGRT